MFVSDRCQAVPGDFFDTVPSGGDTYIMKNIIHDWDDDRCVTLLRNIRTALKDGNAGKYCCWKWLSYRRNPFGILADIEMLALPGGRERQRSSAVCLPEPGSVSREFCHAITTVGD